MARTFFVVTATALLLGCQPAPAPTPPVSLSTLTRPTVTLSTTGAAQNLWIAHDAVVVHNGIPGVYVLQDGRARFRMIRRGRSEAGRIQILSGLLGNETLVLGDRTDIHDGSPIVTAASTPKKKPK